jgi:hypothetical protein
VRLQVGPFDPALPIRSRDHHRAICREAALLDLPPGSLPRRWEACAELERLVGDVERWAQESDADVLKLPEEVRAYYAAFLAQARGQLEAAGA